MQIPTDLVNSSPSPSTLPNRAPSCPTTVRLHTHREPVGSPLVGVQRRGRTRRSEIQRGRWEKQHICRLGASRSRIHSRDQAVLHYVLRGIITFRRQNRCVSYTFHGLRNGGCSARKTSGNVIHHLRKCCQEVIKICAQIVSK